jgi:hypothetical protein
MLLLGTAAAAKAQNKGPTDWSDWQTYRDRVQHPAAAIKAADLARAKQNIERYAWAKKYLVGLRKNADGVLPQITADYLARMIERTTPGCVGPCPACRAKGLPWHPNGQWSWSAGKSDQLTCSVCKTVFPNNEFPESIVLQSKWDPEQRFGFVGGEPFRCHGYIHARPSISGIIRAQKVNYVTGQLHVLGLAFALTKASKYARGAKAILLRFAEVLPKYLVRAGYGYGEYADCDPHVAAERIMNLPQDELVYPPNRPDRKLYAGYWAASRIGTSGMDGSWVCRVAQAYDLTCSARDGGAAVYADEERIRIERDVLLESTYLAVCDPAINNKSVGNRAGAAMVGMCVGHPGLVRFGLEGLRSTVGGWFLPDGGTSESSGYALMTMSGIQNLALLLRNYSDPVGYVAPDGQRLDHFDSFRDTRYGDCWQSLIWTLQGDLRHPPSADSYRTTSIDSSFAELIAIAYPTDEHVALLKELSGKGLAAGGGEQALLLCQAGLESRDVPALTLHDVVFPFLSQAYLRTGPTGRSSLALLNASNWGGHHHLDSLDLYYWKDGRELLSDLGYLWDHADKKQTSRSVAHNLVMIDGKDQKTAGRGGSFHLFAVAPHVKATEASSHAYDKAPLYRRTCIQIDHGEAGSYLVDVFRVRSNAKCQYIFHGPGNDFAAQGLNFAAATELASTLPSSMPLPLENARQAPGDAPWHITWRLDKDYQFTAFAPGSRGETITLGSGWGQRDHRNTDRGALLPYVIRTVEGGGVCQFISVFAGATQSRPLVKAVRRLPLPPGAPSDTVAVEIETAAGTDVLVSMLTPAPVKLSTSAGELATDGRIAAVLMAAGKSVAASLIGGTRLVLANANLSCPQSDYRGKLGGVAGSQGESWFTIEGELPSPSSLAGQTVFIDDGTLRRAYPIRLAKPDGSRTRIYTKLDGVGFEARMGDTWEFIPTVSWQRP